MWCKCVRACVCQARAPTRVWWKGRTRRRLSWRLLHSKVAFFFIFFLDAWSSNKKKTVYTSPDVTTLELTPVAVEEALFFHRFLVCVCASSSTCLVTPWLWREIVYMYLNKHWRLLGSELFRPEFVCSYCDVCVRYCIFICAQTTCSFFFLVHRPHATWLLCAHATNCVRILYIYICSIFLVVLVILLCLLYCVVTLLRLLWPTFMCTVVCRVNPASLRLHVKRMSLNSVCP